MDWTRLQDWFRTQCKMTFNIASMLNLEHLNISKKNIKEIHHDIQKLPNLKSFTACYSRLEKFNFNSDTITHIVLISNEISHIDIKCKNLISIDITDNPIKRIKGVKEDKIIK